MTLKFGLVLLVLAALISGCSSETPVGASLPSGSASASEGSREEDYCSRYTTQLTESADFESQVFWLQSLERLACDTSELTFLPEACFKLKGTASSKAPFDERRRAYDSMKSIGCDMSTFKLPPPNKKEGEAMRQTAAERFQSRKDQAKKEGAAGSQGGGRTYDFARGEDGIGYRWIGKPDCDLVSCYQIEVKALRKGCPEGLYVEIDLLDSKGTVIGYSNDVLGSLQLGERGLLTLPVTEDNVQSARVNMISCWS